MAVVSLTAVPLESGTLTLRGCSIQVLGCLIKEFLLPSLTDGEKERLNAQRDALTCEHLRSKYCGIESFPWNKPARTARPKPRTPSPGGISSLKFWECEVVPELPLLRIVDTSMSLQNMKLYSGERSVVPPGEMMTFTF
jgi:hypothetical protein